jgi:hypothetical protein
MLARERTFRLWLSAASRPFHLVVGALGPALAVFDHDMAWAVPVAAAAYGTMVIRTVRTQMPPPPDPLTQAGPEIAWANERKAIDSAPARSLLERLEQIDRRVTQLAREARGSTQGLLVAALSQVREAERTGLALARATNRLESVLCTARPEQAKAEAQALEFRARTSADIATADALRTAARERTAYAERATAIAVLYERVKAESDELLAQLEYAALNAEWTAARTDVFERVRVDTALLNETLAEVDALEAQPSGAALSLDRARCAAAM